MSRYPEKLTNIEVTTVMGCRLNCKYCPQKTLLRAYEKTKNSQKKQMTLEDFVRVLPQIYENGTITFSGMSETFQNRESSAMMKKAYEGGANLQLFTTLQGMRDEDFEILQDVKFKMVVLHIPDEEGNSQFTIDEEYLRHLKRFIKQYDILYYSCHGKVHSAVKDIIDPQKPVASKMHNRGGHIEDETLEEHSWERGRIVCTGGIFNTTGMAVGWTPMLLPNGVLLPCCNDYGLELILGNLYEQSWEEILNSPQFDRLEHSFDDDSVNILCRKCNRAECRETALKKSSNIIWNNAIKVGRVFQNIESKKMNATELLGAKGKLVNDLIFSENVCIFGLGKLFFDTFDKIPWKNILLANKRGICSDNGEKWKTDNFDLFGLQFVAPDELKFFNDLVVITYVSNDETIREQLHNYGIYKIINIYEIFNILD